MKTRVLIASFLTVVAVLFSISSAFAKTASCPCSPCKCSPCTCGGGGSKSGGKHHDKEHGHGHSESSGGVGGSVDLSGIGHRTAEPDPFAAGGGEKPVAHTEEKKTPKRPGKGPEPISFDKVELTGNEAKEVDENPSQPPSGGSTTVSDNEVRTNDSPAPETKEKPKAKKPKPTWPKPIQDWLDARAAVSTAKSNLSNAQGAYYTELYKFYGKSAYHDQLQSAVHEACDKVANAKEAATQADKDACEKARKALRDQEEKLAQDFDNSPEGKKAIADIKDAKTAVTGAEEVEKAAAKDIDEPTQKKVLKKMEKWSKEQSKEPSKGPSKE